MRYSAKNSSLWLLTCSDLFFLLFAFFVLNHHLIAENSKNKFKPPIKVPAAEASSVRTSIIDFQYENLNGESDYLRKDMDYLIGSKWFSDENSLSSFGEIQINLIKKIVKEHGGIPQFEINALKEEDAKVFLRMISVLKKQLESGNAINSGLILKSGRATDQGSLKLVVRF